ncbi:hypothetical protein [Liquorilactobacillus capillatus]|nr:hypothetical protein [Liquorilactobacillus capillatus]
MMGLKHLNCAAHFFRTTFNIPESGGVVTPVFVLNRGSYMV